MYFRFFVFVCLCAAVYGVIKNSNLVRLSSIVPFHIIYQVNLHWRNNSAHKYNYFETLFHTLAFRTNFSRSFHPCNLVPQIYVSHFQSARVNDGSRVAPAARTHTHVSTSEMTMSALTSQPHSFAALWPVLVSHPAEGRRPSWPASGHVTRTCQAAVVRSAPRRRRPADCCPGTSRWTTRTGSTRRHLHPNRRRQHHQSINQFIKSKRTNRPLTSQ